MPLTRVVVLGAAMLGTPGRRFAVRSAREGRAVRVSVSRPTPWLLGRVRNEAIVGIGGIGDANLGIKMPGLGARL